MESQVVLGFDFGEVRIGVAVGNSITASARALTIIDGRTNAAKWPAVAKLLDEWCPACVVVGIPRHPDGTAHQVTALALKFARQLSRGDLARRSMSLTSGIRRLPLVTVVMGPLTTRLRL